MKFTLTFKTPDVADQIGDLHDNDAAIVNRLFRRFVQYGEYVRIEFDTKDGTAVVLEN